jgi:hypothetical protein
MKKLFLHVLILLFVLTVIGCTTPQKSLDHNSFPPKIHILCPTGAPALSLVNQYKTINQEGSIDLVDGSDILIAELSKTNSIYDITVAPINIGAKLIEMKQTDYLMSSIITWGNLFYVGTSEEALYATGELALFGEGAVPSKIVEVAAIETNLNPVYYNSATIIQQLLLTGNVQVGLLPEPLASATIAKGKQDGISLQIIKDLQEEYKEGKGYPQAAIFVKNLSHTKPILDAIETFCNNGFLGLTQYLEDIGLDTLNLPSIELVISSMERQNIHFRAAHDCKEEIAEFLQLFGITFNDNMLIT